MTLVPALDRRIHKGGPDTGLFLQITSLDQQDPPIPGKRYSFSVPKQALAMVDLESLQSKNPCVLRVELGQEVEGGLGRVSKAMKTLSHKAQANPAS